MHTLRATSHSRTVLSWPPEASISRPSAVGPNATDSTALMCPASGLPTALPVTGSHSRTFLSWLPEASISRPSAVVPNATESTASVCLAPRCDPAGREPAGRRCLTEARMVTG
jgi:hypothetical protein